VKTLLEKISDFVHAHDCRGKARQVAVYGDLMLDLYESVKVNRLSPEFPIPVLDTRGGRNAVVRPGGAGNVCEQFKHFNAKVKLFAFINGDASRDLEECHFDTTTCHMCPCHVPLKRRYYDEDFPLCRMDHELPKYGLYKPEDERNALLKKFVNYAEKNHIDVAILSDYNKGVFDPHVATNLVWACRNRGITTIVDPKKHPFQWQHCTVFKPNLAEAASFLRLEQSEFVAKWQECVHELKSLIMCEHVVVTNGGKGVFGVSGEELFEYKPDKPAADVRSVIGAGDSFAAILALAISHGYAVPDAVAVAYEAAAVYVQKKHNEAVWPHELLGRVEPTYAKILSPDYMAKVCREYKGKRRIVFTNGCFDILHRGHVSTLEFAKSQGDVLIVAANTDESVRRLKGESRPVNDLYSRRIMLAALGCVDFVTYFGEDTPEQLISLLKPDIVVKGGQYAENEVVGHKTCKVVLAPMSHGLSTTDMIEKIKKSNG
jgi:D-beta-D-heptose 7-phosphate kinase/D-beta-D-heptose 1-phosphate adenosyltransferase